ncbi:DNA-binding IclR family transcriptional regulator, partial [Clostridium algifaecis]|nr:DNA-binding IclR family transcriptional regulator [Clostridium algifaecis]
MGLHKSTLYGIITTLEEEKLLNKDVNNLYSLGSKLYEFGKIYEKNFSIKELARPYLKKISNDFKETVHLAIECNFQVTYMDIIQSTYTIGITSTSKDRSFLHSTAVGKIFLAYMNE